MVRDRPVLDSLPAHELAGGVEQHLIGVHVAVVVRRGDRLGVEIVRARAERADDEPVPLEGLVDRRRLMHAADDRLEVVDVERPGIELTVPPHHVERVMVEDDLVEPVVLLDHDREGALLIVGAELTRDADVALAVRRPLDQLTHRIEIALRRPDVAATLHHQELRRLGEAIAVQDVPMDDEIIAGDEREIAVLGLEVPLPLRDIHDLVPLRVPVEMLVLPVRRHVEHRDVVVEEHRDAVERRAPAAGDARRLEVPVLEGLVIARQVRRLAETPDRGHGRGRMNVIQQRRRAGESLDADELLVVDRAIRLPEGDVPLARDLPQRVVVRHQRFPRSACSRSMLSKSALKLPAPKLLAPFRWMISKKSVGRSCTGLVKIWSR